MKDIKFRAWDGQCMHQDWMVFTEESGETTCRQLAKKAEKVMQYTGLKDKNEKEIYEGDIIQSVMCICGKNSCTSHSKDVFTVEWDEFQTGFYPFNQQYESDNFKSAGNKEIIGNIYENPELLK